MDGNTPIKVLNKKGKFRKPGNLPFEKIVRTDNPDFMDFLKRCFVWDPEKRMTPLEAL